MRKQRVNLFRALFGAEAVASAYGYVATLLKEGPAMIGSVTVSNHFLEVAYVFAFSFGILMLAVLFWGALKKWKWFRRLVTSQSEEFGKLYDELAELRDKLSNLVENPERGKEFLNYTSRMIELDIILQGLRIPTPSGIPQFGNDNFNVDSLVRWQTFLMALAATSRTKDIASARKAAETVDKVERDAKR